MNPPSELRSRTMRAVRGHNTSPELLVRRLLHGMGYRYRLHRSDLPGKPDIVFGPRGKVLFVHGCFWHGHNCKRGSRKPATNSSYWKAKICRNVTRYSKQLDKLARDGWSTLTLWECELKNTEELKRRLVSFLEREP